MHEAASAGFGRGARDYEAGRPGYPAGAVEHVVAELAIGPASRVVDLGAGTGKFTRLLVATGARVLAVEPVAEMRDVFREVVPGVEIVDGTGEAVPVDDAFADAVTAAQVFHWVQPAAGVAEVHRVLREGGGVALLWNSRDRSVGWTRRIAELMDGLVGEAPRYAGDRDAAWQAALVDHGGFSSMSRREFRLDHATTLDATLARVASTSYVSVLADAERAAVLDEVRAIVRAARLGEAFVEPYVTEVFVCHKD